MQSEEWRMMNAEERQEPYRDCTGWGCAISSGNVCKKRGNVCNFLRLSAKKGLDNRDICAIFRRDL